MSADEKFIQIANKVGYGALTALELYNKYRKEFLESGKDEMEYIFSAGGTRIKFQKHNPGTCATLIRSDHE